MKGLDLTSLPPGALEWLVAGERGISSESIFQVLTGMPVITGGWGPMEPADPADFIRCEKLLEAVPAFRERLPEMAGVSPYWAGLVGKWDLLVSSLDAEVPGWREGNWGRAPDTYRRMREIKESAQATQGRGL